MTTRFQIGDRIHHESLGHGSVTSIDDKTVEVRLDAGDRETRFVAGDTNISALDAWTEGRISPSKREAADPDRFIPPLTQGEKDLAWFLDRRLEPEWRIYVRPHLDADHPVIAAIHPRWGGMIWDVCPWDITDASIEGDFWRVVVDGSEARFLSPIRHLDRVRAKLYGTYLPQIGEALNEKTARFSLLGAGLYFPRATTADVRRLIGSRMHAALVAFGHDTLEAGDLGRTRTVHGGTSMADGWFDEFDAVLSHAYRQGDPLQAPPLPAKLVRHTIASRDALALNGVAGSAKTTLLAYRAVQHAALRERVLIVTFNRTLANYIRWLCSRVPIRHRPEQITVVHLHALLSLIFNHLELRRPSLPIEFEDDSSTSRTLERAWPNEALAALKERGIPPELQFDAILVDEGQDFSTEYADVLDELQKQKDAAMVVAFDPAQAIYERPSALSDPTHAWSKLKTVRLLGGFRLAAPAASAASAFADRWHLPTSKIDPIESGPLSEEDTPVLIQAISLGNTAARCLSVLRRWQDEAGYLASRTVVLVPAKDVGSAMVKLFAEHGMSSNHVFPVRATGGMLDTDVVGAPDWLLSQSRKDSFVVGDARLKLSTVFSFKGWDAANVVFLVPPSRQRPTDRGLAQVYVGITRSTGRTVLIGDIKAFGLDQLGLPVRVESADPAVATRFEELLRATKESKRGKSHAAPIVEDIFGPEEWRGSDDL
jgi:hypothetical protein